MPIYIIKSIDSSLYDFQLVEICTKSYRKSNFYNVCKDCYHYYISIIPVFVCCCVAQFSQFSMRAKVYPAWFPKTKGLTETRPNRTTMLVKPAQHV